MSKAPRMWAELRPSQREALASFPEGMIMPDSEEVRSVIEQVEPLAFSRARTRLERFKCIARVRGRWLVVYLRDSGLALHLRLHFDEEARWQKNPNIPGSMNDEE